MGSLKGPDRICVRLGVQLGLFHKVVGREGRPIDAAELAESTGAEKLLIGKCSSSKTSGA